MAAIGVANETSVCSLTLPQPQLMPGPAGTPCLHRTAPPTLAMTPPRYVSALTVHPLHCIWSRAQACRAAQLLSETEQITPAAVVAGAELAQELGMHYAFLCEFIELRSPQRDAESQGGGVHGNAILSRLPIASAERIEHSHHPVDWNSDEHTFAKCAPPPPPTPPITAARLCPPSRWQACAA